MTERGGAQPPKPDQRRRGSSERKAVLNVTVSESVADEVRRAAALEHTTISSVVERALREQLDWEIRRLEGLAAIEAYYRKHGYPTPEERVAAEAEVAEEHRLISEALAAMDAEGWAPPAWLMGWPERPHRGRGVA
jgi:hypothetical protein